MNPATANVNMMYRAKQLVAQHYNEHIGKTENVLIDTDDVYIVWFSKTLQNWKALLSTNIADGRYYEVTHNGDKKETYLDVYVKHDNVCIPD